MGKKNSLAGFRDALSRGELEEARKIAREMYDHICNLFFWITSEVLENERV